MFRAVPVMPAVFGSRKSKNFRNACLYDVMFVSPTRAGNMTYSVGMGLLRILY